MPDDTEVLITHGPSKKIGNETVDPSTSGLPHRGVIKKLGDGWAAKETLGSVDTSHRQPEKCASP
jgi:hypothetical protein